jgi:hypothetical protein
MRRRSRREMALLLVLIEIARSTIMPSDSGDR